jgi:hypothetical protein
MLFSLSKVASTVPPSGMVALGLVLLAARLPTTCSVLVGTWYIVTWFFLSLFRGTCSVLNF